MKEKKEIENKIKEYERFILECSNKIKEIRKDTDWTAKKQDQVTRLSEDKWLYQSLKRELEWVLE